jgi:hypothetical protein
MEEIESRKYIKEELRMSKISNPRKSSSQVKYRRIGQM